MKPIYSHRPNQKQSSVARPPEVIPPQRKQESAKRVDIAASKNPKKMDTSKVGCTPSPDVCRSPKGPGPIPTPYPNVGRAGGGASRTQIETKQPITKRSRSKSSSGDEAGTATTKSGGTGSPKGGSKVRVNGKRIKPRVHTDSSAKRRSRDMSARAYTYGNDVHFGETPTKSVMAHEAAHVLQQQRGYGQTDDPFLEHHADRVAERIKRGEDTDDLMEELGPPRRPQAVIQRLEDLSDYETDGEDEIYWMFWAYITPNDVGDWEPDSDDRAFGREVRGFQRYRRTRDDGTGRQVASLNTDAIDATTGVDDDGSFVRAEDTMMFDLNGSQLEIRLHDFVDFRNDKPSLDDVQQRDVGDCQLLATLVCMANSTDGRERLLEIVDEVDGGFSVEFYRMFVGNSRAGVNRNSTIRVNVSNVIQDVGSDMYRVSEGDVTPEEATDFLANESPRVLCKVSAMGLPTNVRIRRFTYPLWPWAIEKAYAAVVGGYDEMSPSFDFLAMAVLTGDIDSTWYETSDWEKVDRGGSEVLQRTDLMNQAEVETLFQLTAAALSNGEVATAGTMNGRHFPNSISQDWIIYWADDEAIVAMHSLNFTKDKEVSWAEFGGVFEDGVLMPDGRELKVEDIADHKDEIIKLVNETPELDVMARTQLYYGDGLAIAPTHRYAVLAVHGTDKIELHNPWGMDHPGRPVKSDEFAGYFARIVMGN